MKPTCLANGSVDGTYASLPFDDGKVYSDWNWNHFADLRYAPEFNTDYADSRQYSPTQGRWVSPHPMTSTPTEPCNGAVASSL